MDEPRALPTQKQQSWGALLSIIVILCMVVGGAFYAWHKRTAEEAALKSASQGGADTPAVTYATTTATTATSTP